MTRPDAQSHAPIHGGTPWTWVPWHVAEGPSEVRCAEGWLVCTTSSDDHARLIAAAPELLEAAIAVLEPYKTLTDDALVSGILMEFGPPKPEKGAALLLIRKAIALATDPQGE